MHFQCLSIGNIDLNRPTFGINNLLQINRMLISQKQKVQNNEVVLRHNTTVELTQTDLSCFLISCQMNGIEPDDFDAMMYDIMDHCVKGADELSWCELDKPLLFLHILH